MDDIRIEDTRVDPPVVSVCPCLGLKNDPSTALSYPSGGNHCRLKGSPRRVSPQLQQDYCLHAGYPACLDIRAAELSRKKPLASWSGQLSVTWAVAILAGLLGLASLVYLLLENPIGW